MLDVSLYIDETTKGRKDLAAKRRNGYEYEWPRIGRRSYTFIYVLNAGIVFFFTRQSIRIQVSALSHHIFQIEASRYGSTVGALYAESPPPKKKEKKTFPSFKNIFVTK